jgi:hypothetical protein
VQRHRFAEQKSLHLRAGVIAQKYFLFRIFNTLGNDCHSDCFAHTDDRLHDSLILEISTARRLADGPVVERRAGAWEGK